MYVLSLVFIFLSSFLCSLCAVNRFSGGKSWLFSNLSIPNNSFAWQWAFLLQDSYLLLGIDVNILIKSETMLSTPDICRILSPNSSMMSLHHITLWDLLRVAAYTRFLWSENTCISYPKRIPQNCLSHSNTAISYFSVVVYLHCILINILCNKAIGLLLLMITAPNCLSKTSVWTVNGSF